MNQPTALICGHSSCHACMLVLIRIDGNRPIKCPLGRMLIANRDFRVSIVVSSVIDRVEVRCTNDSWSWVGKSKQKEAHYKSCPFLLQNWQHGCSGFFHKRSLQDHLDLCPYFKIPCKHCLGKFACFCLDTHEEGCAEKPKPCPKIVVKITIYESSVFRFLLSFLSYPSLHHLYSSFNVYTNVA